MIVKDKEMTTTQTTEALGISDENLTEAWDHVFDLAGEVPTELIGAGNQYVEDGVFNDFDDETGREVKVHYDESGAPVGVKVKFQIGPSRLGEHPNKNRTRTILLNKGSLRLQYPGGEGPVVLATRKHGRVEFGKGIGQKRAKQAAGYIGIVGSSVEDSIERNSAV
jgi:hypothetical protein